MSNLKNFSTFNDIKYDSGWKKPGSILYIKKEKLKSQE